MAATPGKPARRLRSSRTRACRRSALYFWPLGKLEIEIDDVSGVVAGVHLERMNRAANQHASSDQEHQRDGDLGGDEDVAQSAAAHRRDSAWP